MMIEPFIWISLVLFPLFGYFAIYQWYTGQRHPLLIRPEKKTHLFEDDAGERRNPFGDISDGTDEDDTAEYKYTPAEFD